MADGPAKQTAGCKHGWLIAECYFRRTHLADSRAKSLRVTPEGRAMLHRAVRVVDASDAEFFAALGQGEDNFRSGLRRLRDGVDLADSGIHKGGHEYQDK